MSNAMNTMNQILEAGRIALGNAISKYNATEWSIEAEMELQAAHDAWVTCQRNAQTAKDLAATFEASAEVIAFAHAAMTEVNAEMTAAYVEFTNTEWSIEAQERYDAALTKNAKAQQEVCNFRNTYGSML
jgi:hypothetical protein